MTSFRNLLLSSAALGLAACGGEGASLRFTVHESQAQATSALVQAADAPPAPTFSSSDGVLFTLKEARIHLRDIRLDLPQGTRCADVRGLLQGAECKGGDSGSGSGTVVIPGPIVVDLMAGTTLPDLSGLRLPGGTYKRIDFRLEEAKVDELPAGEPLIGYSLLVQADFTRNGAPTKLELKLKFSEDARFESTSGVTVGENDELLALLKPQVWLEGLPVSSCLQKGDVEILNGTLLIDDRAQGDCAEDKVKSNIKRSGDLRKKK